MSYMEDLPPAALAERILQAYWAAHPDQDEAMLQDLIIWVDLSICPHCLRRLIQGSGAHCLLCALIELCPDRFSPPDDDEPPSLCRLPDPPI